MSVDVVAWVFRHSEATGNDRLVLLAIADEADDDGTNAFPSIDRIALKARVPKRTVMRCLTRLEEAAALVVRRPEVRGRGHFNTYVVVMGKGVTVAPDANRETARKGAQRRAATANPSQTHRPIDLVDSPSDAPLLDDTPSPPTSGADIATIDRLCALLADAVEAHGGAGRPKVTAAWRRDMRLLLQRGELGISDAKGRPPEIIERAIGFTFSQLGDPGADGFCWADQVRSPGALRRHWPRLAEAKRKLEQGRGVSKGARTIDRVAARLQAEADGRAREPLALPGANQGG